ncbi:sugar O-acetyltransferase [Clostridium botulinum]|uniref:sugar O-acetyltransferase n=1 Tax=unclassified Clostridium TaxID=2614128 RepID=UPI000508D4C9|nr:MULTISPECIES: sugar O-acetyltransferase [unclassified Clostridium]AIY81015.1 maltose acetyltransferase family protein [Clostridium botulinum 202F]KAI3345159.1 sugar O-acetyltransferase [Clostridium botulinum]KFX56600.1 maltose acetyltransferase [Clostridium botulinum]KON11974.1 maltose acetyltransferase [Clostridium botulinum]MBY6777920.1 sugar O-acetyltransferase [Clostridium botulinum]
MTEKEKMLNGDLYLALGEDLFSERQHAKEVIFEFNSLHPSAVEKRNGLISKLFGYVGENFYIEPPFRCDYGYNIHWGENSYVNYNCTILDCAKVTIGKDVLIGPNVNIFTAGHPLSPSQRISGLEYAHSIEIGDGAWIGGGTTINPGVKIGRNAVIGSGSVVTKDIPDNAVAVGNPCRVIRIIDEE